ncbi:hypothetical protein ACIOD2_27420 [Amycolatopsis sp. NPDC088138]
MAIEPAWIAGGGAVISSLAAIWSATNGNRTLKRSDRDSQGADAADGGS